MSKIALGRGLGSLIPSKKISINDEEEKNSSEQNVPDAAKFVGNIDSVVNSIEIEKISKNPSQMRKFFGEDALAELSDSIKMYGVLEPLLVTDDYKGGYQLIAGERRLEAAKKAGLKKVPVIVKKASEQEILEIALIENIQRENLNPIEEARAYKMLSDDFNLTQEEIARRSSKSRSRVANFLRLLSLPLEIQNAISENKISEGHGRAILSLQNPEHQRAMLAEIIKSGLTVREAEEKVKLVRVSGHTRKIGSLSADGEKNSPWRETEEALSDLLSSKVDIKKAGSGTKIIINCYAQEDFDKVVATILEK